MRGNRFLISKKLGRRRARRPEFQELDLRRTAVTNIIEAQLSEKEAMELRKR